MAIKEFRSYKHGKVTFKQGYFYSFKYRGYGEDPNPLIIFINGYYGINDSTGHQWRFIQGININYIPRKDRKRFVNNWIKEMNKSKGDLNFTWKRVKKDFPYLQGSIRRYFIKPKYYISNITEIKTEEQIRKEVIGSWHKDYSGKLKRVIAKKLKGVFGRK